MRIVAVILLSVITFTASAQRTMKDYLNKSCDIVWLGLDFTKMRFVNSPWKDSPEKIKNETIPAWNEQLGESGRFNWNKAFQNDDLIIDYGPVSKANATIDESKFHVLTPHTVSKADLADAVKNLDMDGRSDGIGVIIVIESFDNNTLTGYGYITFFDIASREVLHKQAVSGKPFGVTLFTYWAKAILGMRDIVASRVLRDVQKKFK